jgi:hypothetical protein
MFLSALRLVLSLLTIRERDHRFGSQWKLQQCREWSSRSDEGGAGDSLGGDSSRNKDSEGGGLDAISSSVVVFFQRRELRKRLTFQKSKLGNRSMDSS